MKILIIGASSYLGSRIYKILRANFEVFGTYAKNCNDKSFIFWDSNNHLQLLSIINRIRPSIIINCIALADVDLCEALPEKSYLLNALVPYNLGKICNEQQIKLVHISTDHFENINKGKLLESDSPTCLNIYSYSKLLGDSLLLDKYNTNIVIRTNFFHFDVHYDTKFINRVITNITQNKSTSGLIDVNFTPVSTTFLVESIVKLIDLDFSGVINVASNSPISKYDFLVKVASLLGKNSECITPVTLSKLKLNALRPQDMSLDNSLYMSMTDNNMIEVDKMIKQEIEWIN